MVRVVIPLTSNAPLIFVFCNVVNPFTFNVPFMLAFCKIVLPLKLFIPDHSLLLDNNPVPDVSVDATYE